MSGLSAAGNNGLGQWSVSGRMRSPLPAASIIARISCALEGVTDLQVAWRQALENRNEGAQLGITPGGAVGVIEESRQILQVMCFAIAGS